MMNMLDRSRAPRRSFAGLLLLILIGGSWPGTLARSAVANTAWFERFLPPEEWQTRFWGSPDAQALRKLDIKALADLVPNQAGLRYCRCPACGAPEKADPLAWSIRKPEVVVCRKCEGSFPNDSVPAKDKDKKIPEDAIEVAPGVIHKYPYHVPEAENQQIPDEHLYIAARRDYEAREFLAKSAFYAAVRFHSAPQASKDRCKTL